MNGKLIIGCGYLGTRVAAEWVRRGETVYALTRSRERADELRSRGLEPIVGDVTDLGSLPNLPAVETVLYAVGFDRSSGKSRQSVSVDGLANVLQRLPNPSKRFIYISSTSVYGQNAGEWVDETSPCKPDRENGPDRPILPGAAQFATENQAGSDDGLQDKPPLRPPDRRFLPAAARVAGEQQAATRRRLRDKPPLRRWICLAAEELLRRTFRPITTSPDSRDVRLPLVVLRLSGIYGPNRLLRRITELKSGEPLSGNPEAYLNLIHVDDAVRAVLAADAGVWLSPEASTSDTADNVDERLRARPPRATDENENHTAGLFLVTDDQPVTRRRYYELLATLVGAPQPQFLPAKNTDIEIPRRGSGAGLNKRCRNERMRRELQVKLQFPTIETGLPQAVAATDGQW